MNDVMIAVMASNVPNDSGDEGRENEDVFNRVEPQSGWLRVAGHEKFGWKELRGTDHGAEICRCGGPFGGVKFLPVAGE
jgi:hypothetical protein